SLEPSVSSILSRAVSTLSACSSPTLSLAKSSPLSKCSSSLPSLAASDALFFASSKIPIVETLLNTNCFVVVLLLHQVVQFLTINTSGRSLHENLLKIRAKLPNCHALNLFVTRIPCLLCVLNLPPKNAHC